MNRAYSLITVTKAVEDVDAKRRTFSGMATTPELDRVGDTIDPMGASFTNPLTLLRNHDSDCPIGKVVFKKPTTKGIEFDAEIPMIDEPGLLKDRLDMAWGEIKAKIISAVSIGFKPLKYAFKDDGGIEFQQIEIYELSAVAVPANAGAIISSVKSLDKKLRQAAGVPEPELPPNPNDRNSAASGQKQFATVRLTHPPASGKPNSKTPMEGSIMSNIKPSEHVAALEARRAALTAERDDITEKSVAESRSMDDSEHDKIADIQALIKAIDRDLAVWREREADMAKSAVPVRTVGIGDNGGPALPHVSIKAPEKLEPGIGYARLVKVKMASKLTGDPALVMARRMYGESSEVFGIITKANEVVAGTTLSGNWAADLVSAEGAAVAAFLDYLRPATILGKFGQGGVPSLTRLDFYSPYVTQTGGGAAYWVGEGKPKPLTSFDFDRGTLTPLKIANIAVLTEENIRYSSPNSDVIVRNALVQAIAAGLDVAFVDPTNSGTSNVKPASITNGADTYASSATTDADAIRNEIRGLFQTFIDANNPPMSGVWIMSATNALALSMMMNTLGQSEFPGISMTGGTFQGLPVIISQHIGDVVALVNASDIFLGDEGGVQVDMSREASIEMRSSGLGMDATAGTATVGSVSMFQTNSVALRAERTINWKRARSSAVAYLSSVVWGGTAPAVS